jgi:transposase
MRQGWCSRKLQEAYHKYGDPQLEVLLETTVDELYSAEREAIEIYNSIDNGFNSISAADYVYIHGAATSNSLYTNEEYITALTYLVKSNMSISQISEELGMSKSVLMSIRKCENHKWLKTAEPEMYAVLEDRKDQYSHTTCYTAEKQGIVYPIVVSPEGVEYEVKSLRGFAREHKINASNLERLLHGHGISIKGYYVKGVPQPKYPALISPEGNKHTIPYGKASSFAKEHGISAGKLSELLNGKVSSHKGWKIINEK